MSPHPPRPPLIRCPQCGKGNEPFRRKCRNCGAPLPNPARDTARAAPQAVTPFTRLWASLPEADRAAIQIAVAGAPPLPDADMLRRVFAGAGTKPSKQVA